MREADTIGADKYFHCKANYSAAKRGWTGKATAEVLSNGRESYGRLKTDYSVKDEAQDQRANQYGRAAALSNTYESAEEACAIFRPKGLNEKY